MYDGIDRSIVECGSEDRTGFLMPGWTKIEMRKLRLTKQADFGVIFDALAKRYPADKWKEATLGFPADEARETFISFCERCPSVGFEYDGKPIGGMMFDGNEAHLEVLPEYHGRWGALWRPTLAWLFAIQDPIFVRVEIDNEKCHHFMARNNWRRMKADEKFITYEMTSKAEPHSRRREKLQSLERSVQEAATVAPDMP